MAKPIYLYAKLGDAWAYCFHPLQANRIQDRLDLVRQNWYTLRVQAVRSLDFSLSSTLTAPSSVAVNLSDYEDCIFGFKASESAANFTAAWRGFNTADTAWHSPTNGRFSIDVAPTSAIDVAQYVGGFRLIDGSSYLDVPDFPLYTNVRQNLITGTEPNTPGAVISQTYTGTVLAEADSVVIPVVGMTSGGLAIPFFVGNPISTIGATCGAGTVTVSLGGPVDAATLVGVYVAKLS